jgi:hypothetical protein
MILRLTKKYLKHLEKEGGKSAKKKVAKRDVKKK